MSSPITARLFTDPVCPWGYSASPALRTIEWRYRDQIRWRLVTIGLSEPGDPVKFTPALSASIHVGMRDLHGMPFAVEPKIRAATSARACHAIVATRMLQPGFEWRVLRTLQLLNFNTPLLVDDDDQLRAALSSVEGLNTDLVMTALDSPEVQTAYQRDRAEARRAEGGPTALQGKAAEWEGGLRYTAPSVIFERDGRRLEAGGFQPVEAYDVVIANLGPDLRRHSAPADPLDALKVYPGGLATQEVAAIMSTGPERPDRAAAERSLVALHGERKVTRIPMGNDAIWIAR
jgi:protein-disulfide isomerase-like protein with CxxC motif